MWFRRSFFALLAVFPLQGTAGAFKVFPLNLQFDQGTKTGSLKISNTGDGPVTVQLDSVVWTQSASDGDDQYEPTKDLLVFPKIVKIGRGEERVVRIGFNGAVPARGEKTYRLFMQELPGATPSGAVLNFLLRLSIPVFVVGGELNPQLSLEKITLNQAVLHVPVRNRGNVHAMVNRIEAQGQGAGKEEVFREEESGWYVLPGAVKDFRVKLNKVPCDRAKVVAVRVESGSTNLSGSLPIKAQECVAPREANAEKK